VKIAPYGTWRSWIRETMACRQGAVYQDLVVDQQDIYWVEMRPWQQGRCVLVKKSFNGAPLEVLPPHFSVRTRVHEYGGNAFTVCNQTVFFIHDLTQALYRYHPDQDSQPLCLFANPKQRFADLVCTPFGIVAVMEDHHDSKVKNALVSIDVTRGKITILHQTNDFYASPAVNARGDQIAWISWDHPNMPWDNNGLYQAHLTNEGLSQIKQIDAAFKEQSFFQPGWLEEDTLLVVSDKSNWWNPYRVQGKSLKPLFERQAEMGLPLWILGRKTWAKLDQSLIFIAFDPVLQHDQLLKLEKNEIKILDLPFHHFWQIQSYQNKIVCFAAAKDQPATVIEVCPQGSYQALVTPNHQTKLAGWLSEPEAIRLPHCYGYFYRPKNAEFGGAENAKPPLIVKVHGGPNANSGCDLNLEIQYWTSRGFAFLDVNYRGSTGYGRQFRQSLYGQWAVFDVEDCVEAAQYCVANFHVHSEQLFITGSSAGGLTVLSALTQGVFKAGVCLYPVSDCEALTQETHKFEAFYLEKLIGPYPQEQAIYRQRSPLHYLEQLTTPVLFFQGLKDPVVSPSQTRRFVRALKKRGVACELHEFSDEAHGFKQASTREKVLALQLNFFKKILGLPEQ